MGNKLTTYVVEKQFLKYCNLKEKCSSFDRQNKC